MATAVKGKKAVKIEAAEKQAVVQAVKGLNLSKVIADLGDAQIYVQKSLGELSATLADKVQQIETFDTAIAVKSEELKALHEIEVSASTLDDLQAEIDAAHAAWDQEQEERRLRWNEEEAERTKARKREDADYQYNLQQVRAKAQDEWDATIAKRTRDEQIRQETLVKGWQEREADLKAQEKEVADLRTRVANIPAEIDSAVKREVAIATNSLKREHTQELTLAKKDAETDKKISESAAAQAAQTIARLQSENERLQAEVKAANGRAESIAKEAVLASSGRQALEAVQKQTEVLGQNTGKGR